MAIEVKQLIIKSTLIAGSNRDEEMAGQVKGFDTELLKEEMMEDLRDLIEQSLGELQER